MFNKNFNIILGERASGRTFFLWEISKILKSFGYKICFIGCTAELGQDEPILAHFDFCRILSQSDDVQTVEMIKERVERDKYDFILIDDIDYARKAVQKIIRNINVRKISTCAEIPVLGEEFNLIKIRTNYNDEYIESPTSIEYKGNTLSIKAFLLSLTRELKINNVLK